VVSNARVVGKLVLRHCTFERGITFVNTVFEDEIDFSFSSFQAEVSFQQCRFIREATFAGAHSVADMDLNGSVFESEATFRAIEVGKSLQAKGVVFAKADFEGATVVGDAVFIMSKSGTITHFKDSVTFLATRILGQADFSSVRFGSDARFDLMQVERGAFFRPDEPHKRRTASITVPVIPPVEFQGDSSFVDAQFKAQVDFSGAQFRGATSFDGMVVEGDVIFAEDETSGSRTTFYSEARFPGVWIKGQANFSGALFQGEALFRQTRVHEEALFGGALFSQACVFDYSRFEGPAYFTGRDERAPCIFKQEASFRGTSFAAGCQFPEVTFHGRARFDGAIFETTANFEGTKYKDIASFSSASARADLCFQAAVFESSATFRQVTCRALFFRNDVVRNSSDADGRQFHSDVDFRGLSYDRIYVAWQELLDFLVPFDTQPYAQLERSLRLIGDDRSSGEVYLTQRKAALRMYWRTFRSNWWRALRDFLYYVLARFGVRPLRLAIIPIVLLGLGAFIFSLPSAVSPKADSSLHMRQLDFVEGLGVSVNLFLPVEVPVGAGWRTTDQPIPISWLHVGSIPVTFAFVGTLLKLSGWILVPLGVVTLTGTLKRQRNG
jgi:uncharacterized protein YjbI with pentapeptide repeats